MSAADALLVASKLLGLFAGGLATGMLWNAIVRMIEKVTGVGT